MDTRRVVIHLPLVEWGHLLRMAEADDRTPEQQAAHLIRRAVATYTRRNTHARYQRRNGH